MCSSHIYKIILLRRDTGRSRKCPPIVSARVLIQCYVLNREETDTYVHTKMTNFRWEYAKIFDAAYKTKLMFFGKDHRVTLRLQEWIGRVLKYISGVLY